MLRFIYISSYEPCVLPVISVISCSVNGVFLHGRAKRRLLIVFLWWPANESEKLFLLNCAESKP